MQPLFEGFNAMPSGSAARRALQAVVDIGRMGRWMYRGAQGPTPSLLKRRIIARELASTGYQVAVETGTYRGDTTALLARRAALVMSVELDERLHDQATRRFEGSNSVSVLLGDSATQVAKIASSLDQPAFFWLDAHWSGGMTARGHCDTPIVEELHAILDSPHPHVVLIDDLREFDGTGGYPSLTELLDLIRSRRPEAVVQALPDILRLSL